MELAGDAPENVTQKPGMSPKNPKSAMISCNDGLRPVSFYIETIEK